VSEPQTGSTDPAGTEPATTTTPPPARDEFGVGPRPSPKEAPSDGKPEGTDRGVLAFFRELPVLIILAFALALLLKTFVVQAFFIPSGSMEPTLKPGDRVLVNKVMYHPHRNDIIVFEDPHPGPQQDRGIIDRFLHWLSQGLGFARPPNEDFIKRVIGLPGETVELRNGRLYVDGKRIPQPYLRGPIDTRDFGPKHVPEHALFVLGDNRLYSNDSRFALGFIPLDKVVGRAFVIIWPPSRIGWLH
jgi:signal peptidase I